MSIITGRGDSGDTDLMFSRRIAKTSARVGALGAVDELNSALGLARAAEGSASRVEIIDRIQQSLVALMGELATLPADASRYREADYPALEAADVEWVTATARDIEAQGVRFTGWATPGAEGSVARASLDVARSVARRAERAVLELHESGEPVPEIIRLYFNRLSDLLWILARADGGGSA